MEFHEVEKLMKLMQQYRVSKVYFKDDKAGLEIQVFAEEHRATSSGGVMDSTTHSPPLREEVIEEQEGFFVTSPMIGTFYAAPSPQESPFVEVGDSIDSSTVIGIIEAMKVMNEIRSPRKGRIAEIYVVSGEPVEYGTKLMRVV